MEPLTRILIQLAYEASKKLPRTPTAPEPEPEPYKPHIFELIIPVGLFCTLLFGGGFVIKLFVYAMDHPTVSLTSCISSVVGFKSGNAGSWTTIGETSVGPIELSKISVKQIQPHIYRATFRSTRIKESNGTEFLFQTTADFDCDAPRMKELNYTDTTLDGQKVLKEEDIDSPIFIETRPNTIAEAVRTTVCMQRN